MREMGKEFAAKYPAMAPFLAGKGNDPDVERLLEGLAFLTAQVRQKLDDELPELTHSLINLLFPHYLRSIPSMAILQFEPNYQRIRSEQLIKTSIEVESNPVDGQRCKFQSCYDTTIYPLMIKNITAMDTSQLRISFETANNIPLNQLDIKSLRFYLHGESQWELYLYLFNYLKKIIIKNNNAEFELPAQNIKSVGFSEKEPSLKNYPSNSFSGYRLVQEFFSFPEKFLFFELNSLAGLKNFADSESFEMIFEFTKELKRGIKISTENILLNCTPVINLFPHTADPINLDYNKTEYRVSPSGEDRNHYEIYSIDKVTGYVQGTDKSKNYQPFTFFSENLDSETQPSSYYNLRIRPSLTGQGVNHFLSFVTTGSGNLPSAETISIELTCTNRDLPKGIKINDIVNATSSSPEFTRFKNITKPTNPIAPPIFENKNLFFNLISHLSLNYQTIADKDNLRKILKVYDFHALTDQQEAKAHELRLNGIVDVETNSKTRLYQGAPVHGMETIVKLTEENFASEGEMYLFASIINEFLAEYVTINTFSQLTVKGTERGEVYRWPPKIGQQALA